MKPKISIITPVYNAADYILSAYESIKRQTVKDFEWIIVDDGSNDETMGVIGQLKKKDKRIRNFTQNHSGAGSARNLALKKAEGEYVSFLDIDDEYYDADALERMYESGKMYDAVVVGGYRVWDSIYGIDDNSLFREFEIDNDKGVWLNFEEYQEDYHYHNYIFRLAFLMENELIFPDYKRYQDPVFCLKVLNIAKKVLVVPTIIYKYTVDEYKSDAIARNIAEILKGIRDNLVLSKESGYKVLFEKLIYRINADYFPYIMLNYNDEVNLLLLEIESLSREAKCDIPIIPLTHMRYNMERLEEELIFNDILERVKYITENENKIAKFLIEMGLDKIVIYGGGILGKKLIQVLEGTAIEILGILDKNNKDGYKGYKQVRPEQVGEFHCKAVIITPIRPGNMASTMRRYGVKKIIVLSELVEKLSFDKYNKRLGWVI